MKSILVLRIKITNNNNKMNQILSKKKLRIKIMRKENLKKTEKNRIEKFIKI
jgi:hypothetical protein